MSKLLATVTALLLVSGCASLDYYAHLARGQYALLAAREPIAALVAAPGTDETLRARLKLAQDARRYASAELALPDNGSYTAYADLGRPWVIRNLFAAPEFSLEPVEQCFPIAGCVAYRGYYDNTRAEAEAARLRLLGHETFIGDVPAYSTLGWFDDPLLSTMLRWDDAQLVGTIFHELAHQQVYLPGDTAFNESFASYVEREGLRRWQVARGWPQAGGVHSLREEQFIALMLALRERLQAIYDRDVADDGKRAAKRAAIEAMRADYRRLRDEVWQGYAGYDDFALGEINNARLLPFSLYHALVPQFARLHAEAGGDWPAFYQRVQALADVDDATRAAAFGLPEPEPEPEADPEADPESR